MASSKELIRSALPETFSDVESDFLQRFFAFDAVEGRPREALALALREAVALGKNAELYFNTRNVFVDGERELVTVQSDLEVDDPCEVHLPVVVAQRVLDALGEKT